MNKLFCYLLALVFTTCHANASIFDGVNSNHNLYIHTQAYPKPEPASFLTLNWQFAPQSQKLAATHWLPDFQESFNSRTNDGGKSDTKSSCSSYSSSYQESQPDANKYDFIIKKNVDGQGLKCYANVKCKSEFRFNSSNCSGEYQLSGTSCNGNYNSCVAKPCSAGGYFDSTQTNRKCTGVNYGGRTCQSCYQPQCSEDGYDTAPKNGFICTTKSYYGHTCYACSADPCHGLTSVSIPNNAHCSSNYNDCSSKCSDWECNSGYSQSGYNCIPNHTHSYYCPSGFSSTNSWGTSAQTSGKNCSCGASSGTCYKEPNINCNLAPSSCTAPGAPAEGLKICDGGVGKQVNCCGQTYYQGCLADEKCTLPYDYPNGYSSTKNGGYYWNQTCTTIDGKQKGAVTTCNASYSVDGIQPPCKGYTYNNKTSLLGTICPTSSMGSDQCSCGGVTFAKTCNDACTLPYDYPDGYSSTKNGGYYWNKTCTTVDGKQKGAVTTCNYSYTVDGIQPPCKGYTYNNKSPSLGNFCSYAVGGNICECGGVKFGTKCLSPCEKPYKTCPNGKTLVNTCEDINGTIWGDCQ